MSNRVPGTFRWPLCFALAITFLFALACHQPSVDKNAGALPSPPAPEALNQSAPVTISFACQSNRQSEFEALAAQFQAQNPDVNIRFVSVEDVLALSAKDNDTFDIERRLAVAADAHCLGPSISMVDAGLVRDLKPFIIADSNFNTADFFPNLLDAFHYKDGIWALPADVWISVLYYRQDAFEQAGVPKPILDWTPEQFLVATLRLSNTSDDKGAHYGFLDYGAQGQQAWLTSLLQEAGPDALLSSDVFVSGLRWYTDLAVKHGVMPPTKTDTEASRHGLELIAKGATAMWFDVLVPDLTQYHVAGVETPQRIGLALFPTRTGPKAPGLVRSYWMSASTLHPNESWRWLQFLTRHQPNACNSGRAFFLPARRSVATDARCWDRFSENLKPLAQQAADHLAVGSLDTRWSYLIQAIEAIWSGDTVEVALDTAQRAWAEARAKRITSDLTLAVATPTAAEQAKRCSFVPSVDSDPTLYRSAALTFNAAHPGVQITIRGQSEVGQADAVVGALTVFKQARNLQPFVNADRRFQTTDYLQQALVAFKREGDLWGIPMAAKVRVMYYNRALFDAAGVPYPKPGWTLDDFLSAAQQLTREQSDKKQYGFVSYNSPMSDLLVFLAAQDAWPWDRAGRPQFATPDVIAGVRWFTDLTLKYGVMYGELKDWAQPDENVHQARVALARDGRAAMWTDFSGLKHDDAWPAQEVMGMAPMPVGRVAATRFLWDGIMISIDAADPQTCWEWTQYIVAQADLAEGMPARHSFLADPAFANKLPLDVLATYRTLVDYADVPVAMTSQMAAEEQWLAEAVQQILQGADPEAALAVAQAKARGY